MLLVVCLISVVVAVLPDSGTSSIKATVHFTASSALAASASKSSLAFWIRILGSATGGEPPAVG